MLLESGSEDTTQELVDYRKYAYVCICAGKGYFYDPDFFWYSEKLAKKLPFAIHSSFYGARSTRSEVSFSPPCLRRLNVLLKNVWGEGGSYFCGGKQNLIGLFGGGWNENGGVCLCMTN